jgi:hypothetical protein
MRRLLFPVDVTAQGPGRLYVGGRVYGDLVRLGDCFTAAVPDAQRPEAGARPVSLVVRGILLYRRYLNQVDPGLTAELELEPLTEARPEVGEALVGEAATPPFAEYEVFGTGELHVEPV